MLETYVTAELVHDKLFDEAECQIIGDLIDRVVDCMETIQRYIRLPKPRRIS